MMAHIHNCRFDQGNLNFLVNAIQPRIRDAANNAMSRTLHVWAVNLLELAFFIGNRFSTICSMLSGYSKWRTLQIAYFSEVKVVLYILGFGIFSTCGTTKIPAAPKFAFATK